MKATTLHRSGILKGGGRYEKLQLARNNSFAHAEKGIVFDMNQLKNLLD
jgi:hypothetical protein